MNENLLYNQSFLKINGDTEILRRHLKMGISKPYRYIILFNDRCHCGMCICLLLFFTFKVTGQSNNSIGNLHNDIPTDVKPGIYAISLFESDSLMPERSGKQKFIRRSDSGMLRPPGFNLKDTNESGILLKPVSGLKSSVTVGSGYVAYNYYYRSNTGLSYLDNNIQQHMLNGGFDMLLADKLPFRVGIFSRQTNSVYFRNYLDVQVKFDVREFRRIRVEKLQRDFSAIIQEFNGAGLKDLIDLKTGDLLTLKRFLSDQETVKRYIRSRETIINKDKIPELSGYRDSVVTNAADFVEQFERKREEFSGRKKELDSLQETYTGVKKQMRDLQRVFKSNISFPDGKREILHAMNEAGIADVGFEKSLNNLFSLRTLEIGRTTPNYTPLTLQNMSLKGVNVEMNNDNLYTALAGGMIDYRIRDFLPKQFSGFRPKQYVAAGRLGWGERDYNHIILTGFNGERQLFGPQLINNTAHIYGVSLETQLVVNQNIRLKAEVAQSASPTPKDGGSTHEPVKNFSFKDKNSQGLFLSGTATFPETHTRVEGKYEYQGINFYSFNLFKINSSVNSWSVKADQSFWSGQVHINAGLHKNDYANPFIGQNYNSNTTFTTLTATFHKQSWPVISLGYIPSSQYSIIEDRIYESKYQALNVLASHTYKLGFTDATTTFIVNRFYNDSKDKGFIYFNAVNVDVDQKIVFARYAAEAGISHTNNSLYSLDIMKLALAKNFGLKSTRSTIQFGIKLNHIDQSENRFGYFVNTRLDMKKVGVLNIAGEKGYLPGMGNILVKSEFFNIGLVRYF